MLCAINSLLFLDEKSILSKSFFLFYNDLVGLIRLQVQTEEGFALHVFTPFDLIALHITYDNIETHIIAIQILSGEEIITRVFGLEQIGILLIVIVKRITNGASVGKIQRRVWPANRQNVVF